MAAYHKVIDTSLLAVVALTIAIVGTVGIAVVVQDSFAYEAFLHIKRTTNTDAYHYSLFVNKISFYIISLTIKTSPGTGPGLVSH